MENTTSPTEDAWSNVTTSSLDDREVDQARLAAERLLFAFRVVFCSVGTVGVLGNLFVIVVFAFFIKITDKVS